MGATCVLIKSVITLICVGYVVGIQTKLERTLKLMALEQDMTYFTLFDKFLESNYKNSSIYYNDKLIFVLKSEDQYCKAMFISKHIIVYYKSNSSLASYHV